MTQAYDIQAMARKIAHLKQTVQELKEISGGIMAVERNAERMLALNPLIPAPHRAFFVRKRCFSPNQ